VRILLDTHAFLWANADPDRLGRQRSLVEDPRTELLISAATSWEIAIKTGLGRLELPEEPRRYVPSRVRTLGATPVPIDHDHALAVAELPPIHSDPFDRLLIAQARLLDVPLVTADDAIARYDVAILKI
jgi:PIN domain nuclease of toxin-antitoxin system